MDEAPKFQLQAAIWLAALELTGASQTLEVVLHCVGEASQELHRLCERHGATLRPIPRFGEGPSAYCNKLNQLGPLLAMPGDGYLLSDTDLIFLSNPGIDYSHRAIRAKVVDRENPPWSQVLKILERAGLEAPQTHSVPDFEPEGHTLPTNCNGGLYLLPRPLLQRIAPAWRRWSTFCLEQGDVLLDKVLHSDQLGFALATLELEAPFQALTYQANYPLHQPWPDGQAAEPIRALHYHHLLGPDLRLRSEETEPAVRAAVTTANQLLAELAEDPDIRSLALRVADE